MTNEDWLKDPLEIGKDPYKPRQLKSPKDEEQCGEWHLFHYTTRLKLNGANFFCTKVIDTAHTPEDELRWYLDAFFFELMSACDILLQELNIVYAYDLGLKPEGVRWNNKNKNKFMKKLPEEILSLIKAERKKDWFCKVQWYRNLTTHHYRPPIAGSGEPGSPHLTHVNLLYIDEEGKIKMEEISICKKYLSDMVRYISSVWGKMAQEFE